MKQFKDNYTIDYSQRDPLEGVDKLFHTRWSPRSFRKAEIPAEVLNAIFDAARWTQSCFNAQPWLFITSSGEQDFEKFLALLSERNQRWAKNASLIGFVIARKHFEHNDKSNRWAQFDSGAAWMALTLQARTFGLYTHGMAGIKRDEVYQELQIPEDQYEVMCGFALGIIDSPDTLAEEFANREKPSPRKSLAKIWKQGGF